MSEPIRVLQIVTHMNRGGLETMLMNYFRHIDRETVQFDFLVHREARGDYDDEIESLGGKIYRVSRLIPWSRSYRAELKAFFHSHPEYKIVHVHQDCLSSVALECARDCGIPVRIAHCHSASQDKNVKYLIKLHYKKQIAKYGTALFACGEEAGKWMFCGAPFQVLKNAIDVPYYTFSQQRRDAVRGMLGLSADAFVVGHVGRFSTVKNHTFQIDIFQQIIKRKSTAKLLLVGGGEEQRNIADKVQALGLKDQVIFTGVRTDVADLMQAMDVFVFPSLYEGLPVTLVEAQAAGLPCLVSDTVSPEAALTDRLQFLPLTASAETWAEAAIASAACSRPNTAEAIAGAGYDINTNVQWLQDYYTTHYEE